MRDKQPIIIRDGEIIDPWADIGDRRFLTTLDVNLRDFAAGGLGCCQQAVLIELDRDRRS